MDETPQTLPPLPEDGVRRVLCIVAHPDDMEYGASAAVAAWTAAGVEVSYLLLTRGEAGMAEEPDVVGPLREREQRRACEIVGVSDLRYLDHPDGMLEGSLALRRDIARVVRTVRPDLVLTTNFEVEAYGGLNQADHRAAGLAAVDGTRDAANPWVFRELGEVEGLEAWSARALLVAGHPAPTHAKSVDSRAGAGGGGLAARPRGVSRPRCGAPAARGVHPRDPHRWGRGRRERARGGAAGVRALTSDR